MIVQYLLKNRASLMEQTAKSVAIKKNEEDRYKKVFAELIKGNVVFEDERAADLHV